MIKKVKVETNFCTCEMCHHAWHSFTPKAPSICPSCGSRAWNGKKKLGRPKTVSDTSKSNLPKPKRVRPIA